MSESQLLGLQAHCLLWRSLVEESSSPWLLLAPSWWKCSTKLYHVTSKCEISCAVVAPRYHTSLKGWTMISVPSFSADIKEGRERGGVSPYGGLLALGGNGCLSSHRLKQGEERDSVSAILHDTTFCCCVDPEWQLSVPMGGSQGSSKPTFTCKGLSVIACCVMARIFCCLFIDFFLFNCEKTALQWSPQWDYFIFAGARTLRALLQGR